MSRIDGESEPLVVDASGSGSQRLRRRPDSGDARREDLHGAALEALLGVAVRAHGQHVERWPLGDRQRPSEVGVRRSAGGVEQGLWRPDAADPAEDADRAGVDHVGPVGLLPVVAEVAAHGKQRGRGAGLDRRPVDRDAEGGIDLRIAERGGAGKFDIGTQRIARVTGQQHAGRIPSSGAAQRIDGADETATVGVGAAERLAGGAAGARGGVAALGRSR